MKMRILTGFFFVSLEALLLDFGSGSKCQPLNATLFKNCEQAGFHNSSALDSSIQDMSSLISNMQRKFNCSSLSDLMTCSLHIPKCPSTKLPCKDTCKKFLTDCGNTSIESDGLKALFRGLCEVLPLTNCKTSKSNHFNDTHTDNSNVICHKLVLKQCQKFGYTYTSVTRDYQKVVNSSTIFQQVDGNSTKLRKVVCMEIAPPCATNKTSTQLQVPCKSLCDDAFKESRSQFAKVFKDQEYCLAFPNATTRGQELCQLQQWPDNVYWPSGLWMSLEMTAQQMKKSTGPTVPASLSTTEPKTKATNLTTHQTTRILNTLKPSTYTPTSSPITDTTTPNSTSSLSVTVTKPTLTIGVTTPVTSNYKSMPSAATTETPKPSLSSKATTPTTTINETNSTSPSTKAAKPSSSTVVTAPSTSSNKTSLPAPSPSTKVTTPASPSNKPSSHVSSTEGTTPPPSTKEKTSAPATKVTTPASPSNKPSSHVSSTEGTTPPPSTKEKTSAPTTKVPTPSPGATPTSSTEGTKKGQPPKVSATKGAKMSGGTIAGIVVGVIVLIIAIAAGVVCFRRFHRIKIQYRHSLMVDMDEL